MITLSMFQAHLNATAPLPPSTSRSVNGQERYLLKLLTTLPSQTQAQQIEHLERVLTVLRKANIDEEQRLKLMAKVIDASGRLIATLRQHYIYETGVLSQAQMNYVAHIQSLHYLIIMVYDRVIRHETQWSDNQLKPFSGKGWQRYFGTDRKPSSIIAIAAYQSLLRYQKLLAEEALCYQKPSNYLWSRVNQLYYLAHQNGVVDIDLSIYTATHQAHSIHQLYCQICLQHLLNLRAMRRPNILLVQRLLPEWSKHMIATIEPATETRVYVDLNSNKPPSYLTANSTINPYEDRYDCLFIELTPMVLYFNSRKQAFLEEESTGIEYSLLNIISMIISYRYLQPPLTLPTKYSSKQSAELITGFNDIHYHVGDSKSFGNIIAMKDLREEERPLYNTSDKERDHDNALTIETFENHDNSSLYRILRLLPKDGALNTADISKESINEDGITKQSISVEGSDPDFTTTAPPPLHIMGLILVYRSANVVQPDWSIGVVRWINLDSKNPEVEWQILGHQLVACGLRLEGDKTRSRHFVPAFILGKDDQLQTVGTLIVPPAYFQVDDRVVMRIGNKQTSLRLGRRLMMTDEFSQYEVVQL
ncbi:MULTISPECIES: hypothetical protein [unclassified Psychrobacter]|uniref:hypothetical protein n=1 Tax=unclassified Psychrobacter TaxID=196806 RepID=UPI0025B2C794|nr:MULTISPECIES: hypothetical protein [unclassified Psychrobacter]MDN3453149.1 hypothetical protein [Psychrobacter sp. APC 3350]MDN3501632.1 hypothetical protein [Psychrobacter sp. 5A.1]